MSAYFQVFKTALIFFPFIAAIFTLPYILYTYHTYGSLVSLRIVIVYSMVLYLLTVYFLVILPLPSKESVAAMPAREPNWIPFHFVYDILEVKNEKHVMLYNNEALIQVLFNILMLVPFGMYLRYYFTCSLKKTILFSFLLSLFLELTQLSGLYGIYAKPYRMFDVDDLMANTTGGIVGYALFGLFQPILPTRQQIDEHSYERGETISLFRRIVSLDIDLFCVYFLTWGIRFILPVSFPFCLMVSMILSTSFGHGKTIGMRCMGLELVCIDQTPLGLSNILMRYLLAFGAFYYVPMMVDRLLSDLMLHSLIVSIVFFFLHVALFFTLGALFLGVVIDYFHHAPAFFGRYSNTQVISTIRKKTP